jgi:hypothetical protein
MDTDKEKIHDEQIAPLMAQIIEICKRHEIDLVACMHTPSPERPDLHCSTLYVNGDSELLSKLAQAIWVNIGHIELEVRID